MSENESTLMSDREAKEAIVEIGRRIYNKGFVASNDGNISVKVGENELWATPTGVSKGFMTPEMLVKLDMDGTVLEGDCRPSCEIKMHLRVFRENPSVAAVVHAHPMMATAYAIAGRPLDRPIITEGVLQLGVVPLAPYATPSTEEVPDSIAPYCKDYNAVLLANHGALTWGKDILEAWRRMESVEYYASIMMITEKVLGESRELTKEQIERLVAIRESMGIMTGGVPSGT
ncbi:class II aldolase/adducin family protein [Lientehia hominis]|uniref:class II aldolase/adducin family protein n=1 Tax=Lientehia hominis TaxID=2897778 RepID=UPI002ED8069A